ncbi:transmembrane protein [Candidatus Magnetoovum chiemensis]|nr:transmembrane protein [Candidatus Magnetoovum chiemensis]
MSSLGRKTFLFKPCAVKTLRLFVLTSAVFTFPVVFVQITAGLDPSWIVALHEAKRKGLIFGADIVFTYGPLGYAAFPIYITETLWLQSAAFTLSVYLLFFYGVYLFLKRAASNLITVLFVSAALIILCQYVLEMHFYIIFLVYSFLYLISSKRRFAFRLFLALIFSVSVYIKFILGAAGFIALLCLCFALAFGKRYKEAAALFLTYLIMLFVLAALYFHNPLLIADFISNSISIASGYNEAMIYDGSASHLLIALIAWCAYFLLFAAVLKKSEKSNALYLILSFGILFVSFKHEFVRHLQNQFIAFSTWALVFILYYALNETKKPALLFCSFVFIAVVVISPINARFIVNALNVKIEALSNALTILSDRQRARYLAIDRQSLMKTYNLNQETIAMLLGHSVDIFPWDAALSQLYDFNWSPRPVFQSYSAYTEKLDRLNEKHIISAEAAEFLLYSLKTIDDRYAIFDEPATFRAIVNNYKPLGINGEFIVLKRRKTDQGLDGNMVEETVIQSVAAALDSPIGVPKLIGKKRNLYARINIEYNTYGKLLKLLYKPAPVYIQFATHVAASNDRAAKVSKPYRLIVSNARNGIYLSNYVTSIDDLYKTFQGSIYNNIDAIIMSCPSPWMLKDTIAIEFFVEE